MVRAFCQFGFKLRLVALVSSFAGAAAGHEINPSVAQVMQVEQQLQLVLRLNLDALLAGVDLTQYTDTNAAPQAEAYDVIRARPEAAVAAEAGSLLPRWNALPLVAVDGAPLALELIDAEVMAETNPELPRSAQLILQADVPQSARAFVVTWPLDAGVLILRQFGVEDPYTGFLTAGVSSPPIMFERTGRGLWWLWAFAGVLGGIAIFLTVRRAVS